MSKAKCFVLIILCNHIDKYQCDCNYCREVKESFIKIIKNSFFYSKFFYSKLFYFTCLKISSLYLIPGIFRLHDRINDNSSHIFEFLCVSVNLTSVSMKTSKRKYREYTNFVSSGE